MPTHSLRRHRVAGGAALLLAAAASGLGASAATAASYSKESIDGYQVDATLEGDTLSVVETIDYDFNINRRRGIVREVDLGVVDRARSVELAGATAATATANDQLRVTGGLDTATLRVGDPDTTFDGLHRYQLGYDLVGVPDPAASGRFVFIAIGDRWQVPIEDVDIRVATDFEPGDPSCSVGGGSSFTPCDIEAGGGVVRATVDEVRPGEGVVLEIGTGPARAPAQLDPPPLTVDRGGSPLGATVRIGLVAAAAAIIGALAAGRWVRRAGADRTGAPTNPSEAAYAGAPHERGGVPITDADAAEQVTIQFAPPEGLTPPQGAVVEREEVDDAARTAWIAQAVNDGWITLQHGTDDDELVITHTERADRDPAHMPAPLAAMFDGRREIRLGSYDRAFAAGWQAVGTQLESWKSSSGLWDEKRGARNRRVAVGMLAGALVLAAVVGLALAAGLGRSPVVAFPTVAVTGLIVGAGIRAVLGAPALAVRNPAGYGLWLRTEGFRRFLAQSEGEHARWAADHGLLREYSAWAVALGELDRWNRAAAAAGIPPTDPGLATTASFVGLSTMAHTTTVRPSSGGGAGGFSGGGFGGGIGGGGGGSW